MEKNLSNNKITEKYVDDSKIEMTELVLPNDTNLLGNLLGGKLMHFIDIAGAIVASRHSNNVVATAAIDSVEFRHPTKMGELVNLKAKLSWVGRTSMEVIVKVFTENLRTGEVKLTNKAFLTYVALDDFGKPAPVPRLKLKNNDEVLLFEEGQKRREERLKRKKEA